MRVETDHLVLRISGALRPLERRGDVRSPEEDWGLVAGHERGVKTTFILRQDLADHDLISSCLREMPVIEDIHKSAPGKT